MRRRWKCGSRKVSPDVFTKSFFGSLCTQCWFSRLVGPQTSTTGPSSRRTRTCAMRFPVCSSGCNRTSPCLVSLRSQNLCWFSQPLRFSQRWAMSAGNDACSPRDSTFLSCGAQVLSVNGGKLLKLRSGAISSGTRRAREVHGRSLRHTTFQQFRILMTKVNCLTSSDRKLHCCISRAA